MAAQPSQKAPKEPKTTKGKVLPMRNWRGLVEAISPSRGLSYFTKGAEGHEETAEEVVCAYPGGTYGMD